MAIKVAYVVEYPTPYDVPLFERIAKRPELDFEAIFLSGTINQRGWNVDPSGRFPYKTVFGTHFFISSNTQFAAFLNPGIFDILSKGKYDVIGTSGYIPFTHYSVLQWCARKKIPHFMRSEAILPHRRSSFKKAVKQVYLNSVVKESQSWLAAGTLAKNYLVHYGADPEKVFFLNYTIDDAAFEKEALKARENKSEIKNKFGIKSKLVILYSGRLAEMKDLHTLLTAFKTVKTKGFDVALALLGSGHLEKELKKRIAAENIADVHFLGFHQSDELPQFYGIADLFVLASTYEPWGIVVNEAQAAQLPVIASNVSGAAEDLIVHGNSGYKFRVGDMLHLAACIEDLLSSEELRIKMGKAGRETVKNWGYDRSVSGFVSACKTALGEP